MGVQAACVCVYLRVRTHVGTPAHTWVWLRAPGVSSALFLLLAQLAGKWALKPRGRQGLWQPKDGDV